MAKAIDPELAQKFREIIQQNIKDGAKTKEEYRKGIPSTFIAKDGKEYSLTGVSNYAKTSQNKKVKTKNPAFKSIEGSKENTQVRNASRVYMMADEREGGFTGKQQEVGRKKLQSRSRIGDIETKIGKIDAHHVRMLQMYRPFFEGMSDAEKAELAKFAFDNKYALGDDISNRAMLSKPFHDKIHAFMRERGYQVSTKKLKAGYKFPGVPDLGNTMESRKKALLHFFENVQNPIERKLNEIKWEQNDAIRPPTKKEMDYAAAWFNDNERVAEVKANRLKAIPSNVETFEPGRRLGGIHDTMKVGGGLRRADQALNLGTNIATGNVAGAAVGGGVLAASEILKNPAAQKAIAGQVARLGASRAGKTMMKTIPGLDVLISGSEALSYLQRGELGQAGIASLSGAIGWIPIIGDGAAAALDLTNTSIDISKLRGSGTAEDPYVQRRKKKTKLIPSGQPTRRLKFGI